MSGLLERSRLYKDELPAIKKCKSVFGMIKVFDNSLFETELQQNNES